MIESGSRFTIGRKLAAGFGILIALMLFSATFAYTKMVKGSGLQERIREYRYPATVDAARIQAEIGEAAGELIHDDTRASVSWVERARHLQQTHVTSFRVVAIAMPRRVGAPG